MPRILFRNGRPVFRNGRPLLDTAACRTRCCGGVEPTPCCIDGQPNLCGREFSVCITEYETVRESRTRIEGYQTQDVPGEPCPVDVPGGCTTLSRFELTRRDYLKPGGPYRLSTFREDICTALGLFPVYADQRLLEDVDSSCPFVPERHVETFQTNLRCASWQQTCPNDSGVRTGEYVPGFDSNPIITVPVVGWQVQDPPSLRQNDGTFVETVPNNQCPGSPPTVTTTTITREWRTGLGNNYYIATRTKVTTAEDRSNPLRFVTTTTETDTTVLRWVVSVVQSCTGEVFPRCNGVVSEDCDDAQTYIRAEPCPGQTNPPPVVFLARNVSLCRTMAVGSFCYNVGPQYPRTNDPGNAEIDYRIVDAFAGSTSCCACLLCGSTITGSSCWQNVSRGIDGQLVVGPATISPDQCCCDPNDTITVSQVYGKITYPGQVAQIWNLRDGPFSFRRGDTTFARDIFSRVTEPDGTFLFQFFHGEFANNNPLECEWLGGFGNFIQFAVPQGGMSAQPIGSNDLPCPSTPGFTLNGWTIDTYAISATCGVFQYRASYTRTDGATFEAQTTVTITPPAGAEFRLCGGGCVKQPESVAIPGVLPFGDLRSILP